MSGLTDVMNAVRTLVTDTVPAGRVVTRSWKDFDGHLQADLEAGIYTLVSQAERDYANYYGREAQLGTQTILISGVFVLPEDATGEQIEDGEFEMVEELQAVAQERAKPAIIGALQLMGFQQSGQLEAPYGWVLARFENGGGSPI